MRFFGLIRQQHEMIKILFSNPHSSATIVTTATISLFCEKMYLPPTPLIIFLFFRLHINRSINFAYNCLYFVTTIDPPHPLCLSPMRASVTITLESRPPMVYFSQKKLSGDHRISPNQDLPTFQA